MQMHLQTFNSPTTKTIILNGWESSLFFLSKRLISFGLVEKKGNIFPENTTKQNENFILKKSKKNKGRNLYTVPYILVLPFPNQK